MGGRKWFVAGIVAVVLLGFYPSAALMVSSARAEVAVTDLGATVGGCVESYSIDVNEVGQAVFRCGVGGGKILSYLFDGAKSHPLGVGGFLATDVNNQGQVVGWQYHDSDRYPAYVIPRDVDGDGKPEWFVDDGLGGNALLIIVGELRDPLCPAPAAELTACANYPQPFERIQAKAHLLIDETGTLHGVVGECREVIDAFRHATSTGETLHTKFGRLSDVNSLGDSVSVDGYFWPAAGEAMVFWEGLGLQPLQINDRPQIVGTDCTTSSLFSIEPAQKPAFYGLPLPLHTLHGFDLNNAGQFIFTGLDRECSVKAYAFSVNNGFSLIGSSTVTVDQNDQGQILLLRVSDKGLPESAVLHDPVLGTVMSLHESAAAHFQVATTEIISVAVAINDSNRVVGRVRPLKGNDTAVLWNLNYVPPPDQQVDEIIERVDDVVTGGGLSSGEGSSLTSKLDAAKKKISDGNDPAACNLVRAFANQTEAMMGSNRLSPAEGQQLLDDSTTLASSLGCP